VIKRATGQVFARSLVFQWLTCLSGPKKTGTSSSDGDPKGNITGTLLAHKREREIGRDSTRSDTANFDFKTDLELAAGKYRISLIRSYPI
jgi:hypothetical protein